MFVEGARFVRERYLTYVSMPGGDLVALRPGRMAAAYFHVALGKIPDGLAEALPGGATELAIVERELKNPKDIYLKRREVSTP